MGIRISIDLPKWNAVPHQYNGTAWVDLTAEFPRDSNEIVFYCDNYEQACQLACDLNNIKKSTVEAA